MTAQEKIKRKKRKWGQRCVNIYSTSIIKKIELNSFY